MTIFTQSRLFTKVLCLFSFLMLLTSTIQAQFCLGLYTEEDTITEDELYLNITAAHFIDIASLQFTVHFDPTEYEYIAFESSVIPELDVHSIGTAPRLAEGNLTVAWSDSKAQGINLETDESIIIFKFKRLVENAGSFEFTNSPTVIEASTATGIIAVGNCNAEAPLVAIQTGQLFLDVNEDCLLDEADVAASENSIWNSWSVTSTVDGISFLYGGVYPDGRYEVQLFKGVNTINILPISGYYAACEPTFTVDSEVGAPLPKTSLVQIKEDCPFMEVNIISFSGEPCKETVYFLEYSNKGTIAAENAYIDLQMDYRLQVGEIDLPYTDLGNNHFRFELGSVLAGTQKLVFIYGKIPCDLSEEETLRHDANIFPNEICGSINQNWSGASLDVDGRCETENVVFDITNIGSGDMTAPLEYLVIEDAVILRSTEVLLKQGEVETVSLEANGSAYQLRISQEAGHPANSTPSAFIEACGRNEAGGFSTGFANRFPNEDNDFFLDVDYQLLTGFDNSTRLIATPIGFTADHFVAPDEYIEYQIFFDQAFAALEIIDTLSPLLDMTTFEPVLSNHPYQYSIENNILKLNLAAPVIGSPFSLNGFIKFKIKPLVDVPIGSEITNQATIYRAGQTPVMTNSVFHTVMDDFGIATTPTEEVIESEIALSFFPNPSNDLVTFQLKNTIASNYQLIISDINGQILQEVKFTEDTFEFYKKETPAGIYLYRLLSENGVVDNGFFVLID